MDHSGVAHKIKECMGKIKSDVNMATLYPDKSGEWSVKLSMFYNKYFPTDKDSYAVRLPVAALAISLCSLQIFINVKWKEHREPREYFTMAILLLFLATNYGVYYGIKIGDRKLFTPWIICKITEVIAVKISLLHILFDGYYITGTRLHNVIIGFGALSGNFFLLYIMCHRKKNDIKNVQENADEFSPVMSVP